MSKDEGKPEKSVTFGAPPSPKAPSLNEEPRSDRDELLKCLKDAVHITEQLIKDDPFDFLTGVAHTTSGRFVANNVTADVYVSYRPQREYDTEGLQKIKELSAEG